jgi:alkylation response protein AidB-like acyl-CoA dehydrogenase
MERRDSAELRQFREEVRDWLHANKPKTSRPESDFAAQRDFDRSWQRTKFEDGWAGIAWPKAYGGRGFSPTQQLVWSEEYAAARCPPVNDSCWLGQNHAGPTLIIRGSEAHKARHLPRILNGEEAWCQGFSEPNAGSDLAGLRTRGVVDGDHLVVDGQKIWTTFAHLCDVQELLVRTGAPEARHRGLTWVICDMRTPGIEVRPLRALDGRYHNCEVFYDNVRIPLSNVVGEVDEGWSVAMTTFGFERGPATFGLLLKLAADLEDLVDYARTEPLPAGRGLDADAALAQRLGAARAQVQALRALTYQMVSADEAGEPAGSEGSLMRLAFAELRQEVMRLGMDIRGQGGLSRQAHPYWLGEYFDAFAETIQGGTSEIQRNIIGERLLGLPR